MQSHLSPCPKGLFSRTITWSFRENSCPSHCYPPGTGVQGQVHHPPAKRPHRVLSWMPPCCKHQTLRSWGKGGRTNYNKTFRFPWTHLLDKKQPRILLFKTRYAWSRFYRGIWYPYENIPRDKHTPRRQHSVEKPPLNWVWEDTPAPPDSLARL